MMPDPRLHAPKEVEVPGMAVGAHVCSGAGASGGDGDGDGLDGGGGGGGCGECGDDGGCGGCGGGGAAVPSSATTKVGA